jgi:hypothetical protein
MASALVAGSLFMAAGNAHATLSLDYTLDSSSPLATVYYNPTQDLFLHGSEIGVTKITGIETTQNAGAMNALSINGGTLNFVTGAFTGKTGNMWNFAGGGLISVVGGIAPLSIAYGSTLLSGSFTSAMVIEMPLYGQLKFDIVGATFNDIDHQQIYNYFNIPAGTSSAEGMNLSFIAIGTVKDGFTSTSIASGNIVDVPTPTPIPAAAWLLGSGLLGLGGIRRKKSM